MSMRTRWWVAPVLLAAASQAAAQSGDWTTYGGNDWNQRLTSAPISVAAHPALKLTFDGTVNVRLNGP